MSNNVSHFTSYVSHDDKQYSTTQLLTRPFDDQLEFDEHGKIKEDMKFNINNSTFNIKNSKLIGNDEDKFETMLFLPETEGRKCEGGLRTKGYFKFSYENLMFNDECLILNDKDGNEFKVDNEILNNSTFNIQNSQLDETSPDNSQFKIQNSKLDKLPLISIITVVFNGEKYLEETIQSVINQTYPNVEYIIIDGGSTDGTLDIIKKYEHAIDYWVSEPDKGIYDAMNKGIKASNGNWVNFMNAGDSFADNNIILLVVNSVSNYKDIIYGGIIVKKGGQEEDVKLLPKKFNKKNLIVYGTGVVCHQSIFVRKSKIIYYSLKYPLKGELNWYFDLLKQSISFQRLDFPVTYYSLGGVSYSAFLPNQLEALKVIFSQVKFLAIFHLPKVMYSLFNKFIKGKK
ncbi:glycosyl transferase family 2 [Flexistipes sinusarabici DSM 4947]|uniref:Glycosyl transferase family 2 n=1 Tax=Flexistipes sinusarabici (strain ATCC 49648 / DSM 4947 / MAS 10) TaxID=717231 RepID=F8E8K9_FLESM|nr:glycosyltransferase family 2 protein [Flexistipes sinusarabici]AEI14058.1 glycosyl transferase family 2 [Flexistipes sinusarabici DSM 4947]